MSNKDKGEIQNTSPTSWDQIIILKTTTLNSFYSFTQQNFFIVKHLLEIFVWKEKSEKVPDFKKLRV